METRVVACVAGRHVRWHRAPPAIACATPFSTSNPRVIQEGNIARTDRVFRGAGSFSTPWGALR
ncbi:hypothetical protein D769_10751 [Cupriavidus sp. HMR-1]|nr:hypothetical protein D769_10751 [Cupriavidus sp. HMR-1]